MKSKTNRQLLFEVRLNWITRKKGVLFTKEAEGTVHVGTSHQFGGEGKPWTPEHLFLSAVSSCFMSTYLAFAQKAGFSISNLDCNSIGQVEIVEGKYKFTRIDLYPKVCIADESLREKAGMALEKTHKYCLISNSINAAVFYHSEILIMPATQAEKKETEGEYDHLNLLL